MASERASNVAGALSRIMPTIGGPRSSRRKLYASVVDSILLYGAPIWSCATETQAYFRQAESVHRRACLRVISGRPHVSYEATYVLAGIPSLALFADERLRIHLRRPEDAKEEERLETLRKWQEQWDRSTKGRWTYRLIPNIRDIKNVKWRRANRPYRIRPSSDAVGKNFIIGTSCTYAHLSEEVLGRPPSLGRAVGPMLGFVKKLKMKQCVLHTWMITVVEDHNVDNDRKISRFYIRNRTFSIFSSSEEGKSARSTKKVVFRSALLYTVRRANRPYWVRPSSYAVDNNFYVGTSCTSTYLSEEVLSLPPSFWAQVTHLSILAEEIPCILHHSWPMFCWNNKSSTLDFVFDRI
ncbi:unnamed protein product [Trichogramma brassicae]|uniref:Uncharacterized protein n=1 Tax=Trichogramma brassicae TaxID=86971 RepID=A0A6H5IT72_9HYME|nr:unnamed protein product [Trichogramma brassicae]